MNKINDSYTLYLYMRRYQDILFLLVIFYQPWVIFINWNVFFLLHKYLKLAEMFFELHLHVQRLRTHLIQIQPGVVPDVLGLQSFRRVDGE